MDTTYITLAIHTYDYAVNLRRILEENGIKSQLENVDINGKSVSSGVRVRIPSSDLPLALKIVESSLEHSLASTYIKLDGLGDKVIIPVDFSEYSLLACEMGFSIAKLMGAEVEIIHVYASPYFDGNLSNTDTFRLEITDAAVRKELEEGAKTEMKNFVKKIKKNIIDGVLPPIKFSPVLLEGVAEEAIQQYTRNNPPLMLVMATRGTHKKASQMIGSVAAEMVDNCRYPVFTVPENFHFTSFDEMKDVIFFCNIEQQDLIAMDVFMRLAENLHMNVHLIPVSDRSGSKLPGRFEALLKYYRQKYPNQHFTSVILPKANFRADFEKYIIDHNISLLVVPNKKKNAFSRLFHPGIAHRVVFEKDIPMLALPV